MCVLCIFQFLSSPVFFFVLKRFGILQLEIRVLHCALCSRFVSFVISILPGTRAITLCVLQRSLSRCRHVVPFVSLFQVTSVIVRCLCCTRTFADRHAGEHLSTHLVPDDTHWQDMRSMLEGRLVRESTLERDHVVSGKYIVESVWTSVATAFLEHVGVLREARTQPH
jgi:hypothetical protein